MSSPDAGLGQATAEQRCAHATAATTEGDDTRDLDDHLARARSLTSVADAGALYRDWADRYDRDVFERPGVTGSTRIADLLAGALDDLDTHVVDLGCGTGAVGARLAEHGFRHIVGYDLSPEMLAVAASKGVYERLVLAQMP